MSRPRLNWTAIDVEPCELVELSRRFRRGAVVPKVHGPGQFLPLCGLTWRTGSVARNGGTVGCPTAGADGHEGHADGRCEATELLESKRALVEYVTRTMNQAFAQRAMSDDQYAYHATMPTYGFENRIFYLIATHHAATRVE